MVSISLLLNAQVNSLSNNVLNLVQEECSIWIVSDPDETQSEGSGESRPEDFLF